MKGRIHIGTSGWHYGHWKGRFYPEGMREREFLAYYAGHFRTVEINNTFYQLPSAKAVETWERSVPENFLFAVKASRFITHNKKLKDPEEQVPRFLGLVSALKAKLGPVLFQLPPGFKANRERLETFLRALPAEGRFAFEFRNETWFETQIYDILRSRDAALCIHDMPGKTTPVVITAGWTYLRFHGAAGAYFGSYTDDTMRGWAKTIGGWAAKGIDVYAYFNNDVEAHAIHNAKTLIAFLQDGKSIKAKGNRLREEASKMTGERKGTKKAAA